MPSRISGSESRYWAWKLGQEFLYWTRQDMHDFVRDYNEHNSVGVAIDAEVADLLHDKTKGYIYSKIVIPN
jgi:hypothetical protein